MKILAAGIALLLCGALFLQWRGWPPRLPVAPEAQREPTPAAIEPLTSSPLEPMPPEEDYASVIERPLFLPDRRPPPPEPESPEDSGPEEASDLSNVDLNAVMITPGLISAWVRIPTARDLVKLRIGDDFEGWTVSNIEPDRLVLERQGKVDELILRDYTNAPAPIPPTRQPRAPRQDRRPQPDQPPADAELDRSRGGTQSHMTPSGPSRAQPRPDARSFYRSPDYRQ
jgi:general secretion pathway protein N